MNPIRILICLLLAVAVIFGPGIVSAATVPDSQVNRTGEVEIPVIHHSASQTPVTVQPRVAEATERTSVETATTERTPSLTDTVTRTPTPEPTVRSTTPVPVTTTVSGTTPPPVTTPVPVITVTVFVYPSGPVYYPINYYPPGYAYPSSSSLAGSLVVTSSPSNAIVILDGYTTQTTPFVFTGLMPGYHTVEIDYPGYEAYVTSVNIDNGASSEIDASLVPLTSYGSLFVESTPSGADVYVDGNYEGTSSVTVSGLSEGPHQIELHLAGYEVLTRTIDVVSGQGTHVSLTFTPYSSASGSGSIDVRSDQPGALVYLDGIYKGSAQSNVFNIIAAIPGSHTLLLHVPGYSDFSQTVTVYAGQIAHVDATFIPVTAWPQAASPVSQQAGTIIASSVPSGGQVYLDNQFRGVAPVSIYNVAPGNHIVNMKMAGYADWSTSVQVQAGQALQVPAAFNPGGNPVTTHTPLPAEVIIAALGIVLLLAGFRPRK